MHACRSRGRTSGSRGHGPLVRVLLSHIARSVDLSVTTASPAKTDEPIELPFAFWGMDWGFRVRPGNHLLGGGRISRVKRQFLGTSPGQ